MMHRFRMWLASLVALAAVGIALLGSSPTLAASPAHGGTWVGSWAAAPMFSGSGFTDRTLREIVRTSLGGDQVVIRATNVFGTSPVTFTHVTVGVRETGAALADGSPLTVTFGGAQQVTVPAGQELRSDPVPLVVGPEQDLVVSLYVPDSVAAATRHAIANTTSYEAAGDHAADTDATAFTSTSTVWYLLVGVDVWATRPAGTVVAFGDSITDGVNSTLDGNRSYPQDLARRLRARPVAPALSVLNEGISGNRVLTDADGASQSALHRFDRDVFDQAGLRDVIFLEGINDIGHNLGPDGTEPVTVDQLVAAMKALIAETHRHGVRIIGGTLTPIGGSKYDTPEAEAKRQAVNDWIRDHHAFDGIADFDAVVRDPTEPARIAPRYDSGDGLHPNDAGYQAMADAIDLELLR
jgi:lysophospholipase L1-like esterase